MLLDCSRKLLIYYGKRGVKELIFYFKEKEENYAKPFMVIVCMIHL